MQWNLQQQKSAAQRKSIWKWVVCQCKCKWIAVWLSMTECKQTQREANGHIHSDRWILRSQKWHNWQFKSAERERERKGARARELNVCINAAVGNKNKTLAFTSPLTHVLSRRKYFQSSIAVVVYFCRFCIALYVCCVCSYVMCAALQSPFAILIASFSFDFIRIILHWIHLNCARSHTSAHFTYIKRRRKKKKMQWIR